MSEEWVDVVAGVAEIVGQIVIPIFTEHNPGSPPEPKIHPSLRPGAKSTLSREKLGMGGRL